MSFLNRRSAAFWLTTGFLLVALLGLVDYFSGPDLSFLIFFILPVFLVTWFVGRWAGLLMTGAGAVAWYLAYETAPAADRHPIVPIWNMVSRIGFFIILTLVFSALHRSWLKERELARTDALTGLFNRRAFAEAAVLEAERARRHGGTLSIVYMDMDNFKKINDTMGHSRGDALLAAAAAALRDSVRTGDVAARLGGDEFAVLMPRTEGEEARSAAARMLERMGQALERGGWDATFSAGVASFAGQTASLDGMMHAADRLMYAAKRSGKNRLFHENTPGAPLEGAGAPEYDETHGHAQRL